MVFVADERGNEQQLGKRQTVNCVLVAMIRRSVIRTTKSVWRKQLGMCFIRVRNLGPEGHWNANFVDINLRFSLYTKVFGGGR